MVRLADIHSLTDFKRNTAAFLRRLKKSRTPTVLTVNGEARLVVMDPDAYEKLTEALRLANDHEAVRRGIEDANAGRTTPLADVAADLRKRMRKALS